MTNPLVRLEDIQQRTGNLPGPRNLKVIDFLDEHAIGWLAASTLAFLAFGRETGPALTLAGGDAGFATVVDVHRLVLARAQLNDASCVTTGAPFGSLFLVPGIGETLRINGRVGRIDDATIEIEVRECYLHCAKALIRSAFWQAEPEAGEANTADPAAQVAACRFLALATMDDHGSADVSPKGDPAGALLQWHDGALWYPERPGNRRIDSFRNLLVQPRMAGIALVPGSHCVAAFTGTASVHASETVRTAFAVDGRVPVLVTRIEVERVCAGPSATLARIQPWPAAAAPASIDPAGIFKAHIQASREGGLAAALLRATLAIPGAMRKGLDRDYRKNLY